jgi:hypothetical protein
MTLRPTTIHVQVKWQLDLLQYMYKLNDSAMNEVRNHNFSGDRQLIAQLVINPTTKNPPLWKRLAKWTETW